MDVPHGAFWFYVCTDFLHLSRFLDLYKYYKKMMLGCWELGVLPSFPGWLLICWTSWLGFECPVTGLPREGLVFGLEKVGVCWEFAWWLLSEKSHRKSWTQKLFSRGPPLQFLSWITALLLQWSKLGKCSLQAKGVIPMSCPTLKDSSPMPVNPIQQYSSLIDYHS